MEKKRFRNKIKKKINILIFNKRKNIFYKKISKFSKLLINKLSNSNKKDLNIYLSSLLYGILESCHKNINKELLFVLKIFLNKIIKFNFTFEKLVFDTTDYNYHLHDIVNTYCIFHKYQYNMQQNMDLFISICYNISKIEFINNYNIHYIFNIFLKNTNIIDIILDNKNLLLDDPSDIAMHQEIINRLGLFTKYISVFNFNKLKLSPITYNEYNQYMFNIDGVNYYLNLCKKWTTYKNNIIEIYENYKKNKNLLFKKIKNYKKIIYS